MNQLRQFFLNVIHELQASSDSVNNVEADKFKIVNFKLTKNDQSEKDEIKIEFKKINKMSVFQQTLLREHAYFYAAEIEKSATTRSKTFQQSQKK